jgi:hypothetical protein
VEDGPIEDEYEEMTVEEIFVGKVVIILQLGNSKTDPVLGIQVPWSAWRRRGIY